MSQELSAEIKETIEKNLPLQVGKVLQDRLAQAEKDAIKVVELEDNVTNLRQIVKNREAEILQLQEKLKAHDELDKRQAAIETAERNQKVFELSVRLEAQSKVNSTLENTILGLVRNVEFRSRVLGNENIAVPGGGNCSGYATSVPVDRTTANVAG